MLFVDRVKLVALGHASRRRVMARELPPHPKARPQGRQGLTSVLSLPQVRERSLVADVEYPCRQTSACAPQARRWAGSLTSH